jgi:hypothetical protein
MTKDREKYVRELAGKLKNGAYVDNLQKEGVNVDALRANLKTKENDNATGISK